MKIKHPFYHQNGDGCGCSHEEHTPGEDLCCDREHQHGIGIT